MKNGFYLKVRSYPNSKAVSVWLMKKDGAAHSCWLSGMMYRFECEKLIEQLGIPVERCKSKWTIGKTKAENIKKEVGKKQQQPKAIDLQHFGLIGMRMK